MTNTRQWADRIFDEAFNDARVEMAKLQAQLARTGAQRNSRSVFPMSDVYLDHMSAALAKCLQGVDKRYLKRDKKWRKALEAVQAALEEKLNRGPKTVAHYLSNDLQTVPTIAEDHFRRERGKLILEIDQRRDGWTGDAGKAWHERHPVIYALLLLLAGAVVGQVIERSFDAVAPPATLTAHDASDRGQDG